ncbi:hypothetical protein SDC9_196286 [bioreactor metagenome]|uniref:Uncharacterized protein n=1 Tax=bioreactor metagenome TaxID=1076179 RepID=A0A645IK37_9ZZZZ
MLGRMHMHRRSGAQRGPDRVRADGLLRPVPTGTEGELIGAAQDRPATRPPADRPVRIGQHQQDVIVVQQRADHAPHDRQHRQNRGIVASGAVRDGRGLVDRIQATTLQPQPGVADHRTRLSGRALSAEPGSMNLLQHLAVRSLIRRYECNVIRVHGNSPSLPH